jgi:tetratricopeptide (TPR) repeat protein
MKAEHRHELKTNELADWMAHFPEWAKKNIVTIAIVAGVIVALLAVYMWRNLQNRAEAKEQYQMTALCSQVGANMGNVLQAAQAGKDLSFMLLQPAENLLTFAQTTKNNEMAALALLKRAEALRAELHYRMSSPTQQEVSEQIGKALQSYSMAIEKAPSNYTYVGMARYGQGLCAEELGDFEKARQTYQEILDNPDFEPTVARARAEYRLQVMDDYKQKTTFKPAPASAKPPLTPELNLLNSLGPIDANRPADTNKPTESNEPADANSTAVSQPQPADANAAVVPETPDKAAATPDANASGQ